MGISDLIASFLQDSLDTAENGVLEVQRSELAQRFNCVHMAYKITSACVSCGSCADVCPAGAISQGDDQYVIDSAACLDCGSCSDTCPNGAIVPEE